MPQLDSLRAAAVLMVLFQHYTSSEIEWGSYGVSLFFVLSGFLITRIILVHKSRMAEGVPVSIIVRNFYIRRALRLIPVYYLTLIIGCLLGFDLVCDTLPWHLTYTSNFLLYFRESWMGVVTPYWSLANEEQFYLLWLWFPLFLSNRNFVRVVVLVVLIAMAYRLAVDATGHNPWAKLLLPGVFDSFAIGAALCLLDTKRLTRKPHLPDCLFAVGLTAFVVQVSVFHYTELVPLFLQPVIVFSTFSLLILAASLGVRGPLGLLLDNKILIYVGRISYGIYVLHTFAPGIFGRLPFVWRVGEMDPLVRFAAYASLTIALAALSWRFLEAPINRQKARFSEGVGSV